MAHGASGGKSPGNATTPENAAQRQTAPDPSPRSEDRFVAPSPTRGGDLVKYLHVELDVSRTNHEKFARQMPTLVELMFDYKGWELVYAAYPIAGVVNRFLHIWKIPDESSIAEMMIVGAFDESSATAWKRPPGTLEEQFRWCYQSVQSLIDRTTHTIMTSLPYDPEHVGYQSQTILIDTDGEPFLIDHRDLRREFEGRDISKKLEEVRQETVRTLSSGQQLAKRGKNSATEPSATNAAPSPQNQPKTTLNQAGLEQLQRHLNQGAIVAEVNVNGGKALLFNLAGLKPRSVFQDIASEPVNATRQAKQLSLPGDGKVDMSVTALLIAAPWGAVYELGPTELSNPKVVKRIAEANVPKVKHVLQPLINAKAPIAAIPEEREQTIGDGCACYIINLNSFVAATKP